MREGKGRFFIIDNKYVFIRSKHQCLYIFSKTPLTHLEGKLQQQVAQVHYLEGLLELNLAEEQVYLETLLIQQDLLLAQVQPMLPPIKDYLALQLSQQQESSLNNNQQLIYLAPRLLPISKMVKTLLLLLQFLEVQLEQVAAC